MRALANATIAIIYNSELTGDEFITSRYYATFVSSVLSMFGDCQSEIAPT